MHVFEASKQQLPALQMGTYNTIKATLPHVRASKGSYIHVSATLQYNGECCS